jgi:cell division protein FtsW (lipid II flippase)
MVSSVLVVGLSAILAVVAFLTYRRLQRKRVLMIGWAFVVFATKGIYLVRRSLESRGAETWILPVAAFDVLVLLSLYLAVRVR